VKVIRFIIAMSVFAMSVYPCSDAETCVDEQNIGMVVVNHDNHSTAEQDLCSPFCFCSCCAAHAQIKGSSYASPDNLFHNTAVATPYMEVPILNSDNVIWQPPRI